MPKAGITGAIGVHLPLAFLLWDLAPDTGAGTGDYGDG
jgi:hypothetical protein